jgi:hypothetical protein
MEALVEHHLPRARVVVLDQCLGVVEQYFPRRPAVTWTP